VADAIKPLIVALDKLLGISNMLKAVWEALSYLNPFGSKKTSVGDTSPTVGDDGPIKTFAQGFVQNAIRTLASPLEAGAAAVRYFQGTSGSTSSTTTMPDSTNPELTSGVVVNPARRVELQRPDSPVQRISQSDVVNAINDQTRALLMALQELGGLIANPSSLELARSRFSGSALLDRVAALEVR
jgi:hypothetical protein